MNRSVDGSGTRYRSLKIVRGSKFTNPLVRIWMNTHKYDDSEYMFYQFGNWPTNSIMKVPDVRAQVIKIPVIKVGKRQIPQKNKSEIREIRSKPTSENPWLYKPNRNSLFKSLDRNSLNLYL